MRASRARAIVADTGALPRAFPLYEQALTVSRELDEPDDEAIAPEGLSRVTSALT